MTKSEIKDVSDTAFMVAIFRALESERPEPLFRDPLARVLAGEHGEKIVQGLPRGAFMGGWTVVIRTVIIDRYIQTAIAEGFDTILNLGAGLDTRPYRMELPASLRWIEVDYPHVIELKETRLAAEKPRCRLERVKLDLADATARRKFFREVGTSSNKTLVLTEGVTPYLSNDAVAALAEDLKAEPTFLLWVVDYFSKESFRYRRKQAMKKAMKNAPFIFEPDDYFAFFKSHGWSAKQTKYIMAEGYRLGRPIPLPFVARMVTKVIYCLMPRERREAMSKFAAYVLFERS